MAIDPEEVVVIDSEEVVAMDTAEVVAMDTEEVVVMDTVEVVVMVIIQHPFLMATGMEVMVDLVKVVVPVTEAMLVIGKYMNMVSIMDMEALVTVALEGEYALYKFKLPQSQLHINYTVATKKY